MNTSKTIRVLILILLGINLLLSCKSASPSPSDTTAASQPGDTSTDATDTPDKGGEETTPSPTTQDADATLILIADEITTLEPYRMVNVHPEGSVASHIWDTLTLLNDDLQVKAHLAESWRLVNNLTWEFTLRQDITFHNGEPLDAQAVHFSIERARIMPGSLETFAQDIGLDQVEIIDDHTLRLIMRQPTINLPFHLAFLEILPPIYYSETPPHELAVAPVGSGPYRPDPWLPGQELILQAVPTYWKGAPTLPRLAFQTIPDAQERLAALRDGEAALVTDLAPMPTDQWDSPVSKLQAIESTQRMFIGIRIEQESPLGDMRVRQALNYGVNVEQIIDDLLQGYGQRYSSWVNPPANNPELAPWPYDPDRARELLAQAGYQHGFTTTLHTPIGTYYQDVAIAQAIARQLEDINITVEIETADWSVFVRNILSDDPPSLFLLGLNSRGDGLEDAKNLSTAFAFNPTRWQNEFFQDSLQQATYTFAENSRIKLLNEAQAIAYEQAPWIWLWRPYDFYGISQNILEWRPRRDGLVYLYRPTTSPEKTE